MSTRTAFMWMLRNFLRMAILALAVSFFVFRASELVMTVNTTIHVEAYYIAEGLELPDTFRRISTQEQTWRIVHLILSFVILTASLLIIYSFTLLRREDNGNLLYSENHSPGLVMLRELSILLSISAPASVIGSTLGMVFLDSPGSFDLALFSASQLLGDGLPLPDFWFVLMLTVCTLLASVVGIFAIKRLKVA